MDRIACMHCGRDFIPNPRVKNQQYCKLPECQQARKTLWQRRKLATDPAYQDNQRDCGKSWRERHPEYWRQYREQHPPSRGRNRLLQRVRNAKRRSSRRTARKVIANMDTLTPCFSYRPGPYYLVPPIANMDALTDKFFIIPAS
jgi:hypothetical protein